MLIRVIADIVIFFSILYTPFWLTLLALIGAAFYFRSYYELIGGGILIDMLYGTPLVKFFDVSFITTIITVSLYFIIDRIKQNIR